MVLGILKRNKKEIKLKEDFGKLSIKLHKEKRGKIQVVNKVNIKDIRDLSIAYSPGVAAPCLEIQKNPKLVKDYVINGSTIAVITDGSAVLGLGDIGPKAALPVMEGKCALFRKFAGINAFPIAIDTRDTKKFVETVQNLSPSFAGINLEDIAAPRCFEIEETLKKKLNIPVFHDDQHGTAIVVLAGLINALKVTKKNEKKSKVVINGAGAAGVATAKLLQLYGFKEILMCDSKGIISKSRKDLNKFKKSLLRFTNKTNISGSLEDAMINSDVFIGLSKADLLNKNHIKSMNKDPIVFGLANPNPEIKPELAKEFGVKIIATGRSDYPNQINNVLAFPGIFKGALESDASEINDKMKIGAAKALAKMVKEPSTKKIIPNPFEKGISEAVAKEVSKLARKK